MTAPDATQVSLRAATTDDLPEMARIHREAYGADHFLARLPASLLADYYARFIGGGSRGVVAVRPAPERGGAGQTVGFAVYGRDIERRIAAFKRERRVGIVGAAIANPGLAARRVLDGVASRLRPAPPHDPAPALLLSIAVRASGRGVGRALLHEMLDTSAVLGETRLGLYVRHANVVAINAYLRAGFRVVVAIQDQYYMECALTGVPSGRITT